MTIRTEQTLRRMWEESAKLQAESDQHLAESKASTTQAGQHDRAAAAEHAAAEACRATAAAAQSVGERAEDEAADLADLVNRERQDAGLSPLKPGEPYPADPPAEPAPEGGGLPPGVEPVDPSGSPIVTRHDLALSVEQDGSPTS